MEHCGRGPSFLFAPLVPFTVGNPVWLQQKLGRFLVLLELERELTRAGMREDFGYRMLDGPDEYPGYFFRRQ
jgi:hypothetical protein